MDVEPHSTRDRHTELEEYPYEVLSTEEIVQHMVDCIKEVMQVVEIPDTATRMLLNHFKWDKEKLMERFYDGDQDQLFAEAGFINPFRNHLPRLISTSGTEECEICFSMLPTSLMTGLECGHRFCTRCWCEYLKIKIMEEGLGQTIACAAHTCDVLVDDETVMRLVDSTVKLKYQHIITDSFVQETAHVKIIYATFLLCVRRPGFSTVQECAQDACLVNNNAIKVAYVEAAPVTCRCTHTFCFACGENWHEPVQCYLLRKWIKKYDADSTKSDWKVDVRCVYTKDCPNCTVTIEKYGGCNHMVCRNCNTHFCWLCLRLWEHHCRDRYYCNRFSEKYFTREAIIQGARRSLVSVGSTRIDNLSGSPHAAPGIMSTHSLGSPVASPGCSNDCTAVVRYLFYRNRYMTHMQSLRFESELYASVKEKMEEIQQHNDMSWNEVQFLKKAVDILCQCRQTLMYTYVFAYFLRTNNESMIFEHNQRDLESATENLSWHLQRDITGEDMANVKQLVRDKYIYCDGRRKVLLEHVHEGYEKDCWDYTE